MKIILAPEILTLTGLRGFFIDFRFTSGFWALKDDKERNTTWQIQQIWEEEAGIHLSPEEADNLASNLCAFFDLLIEWDKKETDKRGKPNYEK